MLTVAEATRLIHGTMPALPAEAVSVAAAVNRVLRQQVVAERDQPPFDRVMMDGVAIRAAAYEDGQRRFAVLATGHAGDAALTLDDPAACIEIMTGAVCPAGADCIVPVERITRDGDAVVIEDGVEVASGRFIHPQGSDHAAGTRLLAEGRRLGPLDIAVLASAGLTEVRVAVLPRIAIVATGNELVPPGEPIAAHQVRLSNGPALQAMLQAQGFADCENHHLRDEPAAMRDALAQLFEASDALVLSGGVSMGQADFVPAVLRELGVREMFHRVSQRPGKPLWFGATATGKVVFALPGNPVSALTCCRHYVLPALLCASGAEPATPELAVLTEDFRFAPPLTCFLPVTVTSDGDGTLLATPAPTNTSGDFTRLADSDGYVELALEQSDFAAGTAVPLHRWERA